MFYKIRLFIFLSFFLVACDSSTHWKDAPYEVYTIDSSVNTSLGYAIGDGGYIERIAPRITSAGSNGRYVVARQCKDDGCHFYYIVKQLDSKFSEPNTAVNGPFSEEDFLSLSEQLKLPQLKPIK